MRSGCRGRTSRSDGRRTANRLASAMRCVTAIVVVLGVLAWAALPAFSFSLDRDTGSTTCRMACANTPDCCCKPVEARKSDQHRTSGPELSTPARSGACPRDCATLTVVPGTSTARFTDGSPRLGTPDSQHAAHPFEMPAELRQGLYDVARPRGPPTRSRDRFSLARVSQNTPVSCASLLGEPLQDTVAGSGSSESTYWPARRRVHPRSFQFKPSGSANPTTLASRRGQGPIGADADICGGTHE